MKNVTIYTTPVCHWCHVAKEFFAQNNIPYTAIDVASDPDAREKLMQMVGKVVVPIIVIDNDVLVGFQEAKLRELLGI